MKYVKSLMEKVRRGQGGFTLIELLIVIGILGAIAAVVMLNLGNFIGTGECQAYCIEKHNLQTATLAYMADAQGAVPSALTDLNDYLVGTSTALSFNWSTVTFGTDGALVGEASDQPAGCNCTG